MKQRKYKIFLADDSLFIQKFVSAVIDKEPDLEMAGIAGDGREAMSKIPLSNPDLVILDIEMPGANGLEVLKYLSEKYPLPVLVLSSFTEAGAEITMEALNLGALDFIPKRNIHQEFDIVRVKEDLLKKVRDIIPIAGGNGKAMPDGRRKTSPRSTSQYPLRNSNDFKTIVIGSSTGGPRALETILKNIPFPLPVPVVIAQHMPPKFTQSFARRLDRICSFPVLEVAARMPLESGRAYVGAGGKHVIISRNDGELCVAPLINFRKGNYTPSVDILFESAVQLFRDKVLGIILTGMGIDGLEGARKLKEAGGVLLSQDEATSAVYGMPRAVNREGLSDRVLPLNTLSEEILRMLR